MVADSEVQPSSTSNDAAQLPDLSLQPQDSQPQSPQRQDAWRNKRLLIALLAVLVVIMVAVVAYMYLRFIRNEFPSSAAVSTSHSNGSAATIKPYADEIVFLGQTNDKQTTVSLAAWDGTVKHVLTTSGNNNEVITANENGPRRAILVSEQQGDQYMVLSPDGGTEPVAPTLVGILNNSQGPVTDAAPTLDMSSLAFVNKDELLATEILDAKDTSQALVKINPTTGTITPLVPLKAKSTNNNQPWLIGTKYDGSMAYLIVAGGTVNNTQVKSLSLVSLSLANGQTTVKALPVGADATWPSSVAISQDGNLVAYRVFTNNSRITHLYNIQSGSDIVLYADAAGQSSSGSGSLVFSPDGAYLAEVGTTSQSKSVVRVYSVASRNLVQRVGLTSTATSDSSNSQPNEWLNLGWAGGHVLIYVEGDFTGTQIPGSRVHSLDVATGATFSFPSSLGTEGGILTP